MRFAYFSTIAQKQNINSVEAIILGVSVITMGNAQGHDMMIDEKTLDQMLSVCQSHKDGIKVKFGNDHKAGIDATIGLLKNFSKDGKKLRADFHLLKTDSRTPKVLEMAASIPDEFGLSVVFTGDHEEIDKTRFARCTEIYSADLVSDPAANPTGLFAKRQHDDDAPEDKVEYDSDGKTHSKTCMCKTCKMSKKKSMSELLTPEVLTALKKELGFESITQLSSQLTELTKANATAVALSKKTEIDTLLSEASRDGKVVPFDNDDLYTQKDGLTTILMEPTKLAKVIGKLAPKSVITKRGPSKIEIKDPDGKQVFDRRTPEGRAATVEFCRRKTAENAAWFGQQMRNQLAASDTTITEN